MKSDSKLQHQVLEELEFDNRVKATGVGVEATDGIVTLTGSVRSYAEKIAAQEAAHRVAGVLDVANDIRVTIPGPSLHTDQVVAAAVRHALAANEFVPDERIRTTVSNGWVTLEGVVDVYSERDEAEAVVQFVQGVAGVINNVEVIPARVEEHIVRSVIEEALERRADREADRIVVKVEDGTVTLTGRVRSWAERRAVIGAAGHAPGIRAIDDQLYVIPGG